MEKNIIITGGSRGIGAATALLAAEQGYKVGITYREQEVAAHAIVTQIQKKGGKAVAVQMDVSKEAEIVHAFTQFDEQLGRVTALVNNAGILKQGRVVDADAAYLEKLFATNVIGSFICAREAIKRMSTLCGGQGGGIINVSSIAARLGSSNEYVDYAATKGAIDTFTQAWRRR
jgi:Short-chain dehydrogenases of various substrate specificities